MARPKGHRPAFERQNTLLEQMKEGWVTYKRLQELAGKPERTVRRDIEAIISQGHDVEDRWQDSFKEFRIRPDSIREPIEPGVLEVIAFILGRGVLDFLQGTELRDEMEGLFQAVRKASRASDRQLQDLDRKFWFMPDAPRDYTSTDDQLNDICTCLLDQRLADICYRSRGQGARFFRVAPYTLLVRRECLYVLARVAETAEVRLFDLTRIVSIKRLRERFELADDYDPASYFKEAFGVFITGPTPAETIQIWFREDVAQSLENRTWHPSQSWSKSKGGSILNLQVRVCPELVRWILGFGPTARVVGPSILVDKVKDSMRDTLKVYRKRAPSAGRAD